MTAVVQFVVDALTAGSFYALFALGIALIFGIMQLVNFAHGELIMVGGYTLFLTHTWPWPVAVATTVAVVVLGALLMERIAFRPVRGANPATLLITSFALSFLLQNVAQMIFTTLPKSADVVPVFNRSTEVGGITVSWLSVVTIVTTAVLLVALALFMNRTSIGVQMRAAAEDFEMARLCGVRSNRVIATAFGIGGLLAGVGAVLLVGQTGGVSIGIGLTPVLFGFTAAAVGGLGSLPGAVVGGYLLGAGTSLLQQVLPYQLAGYRDAFLFLGVFVLMAFRPGGLFRVAALSPRV
ncbi:branched-chain amino acid ABC transporter permease [Blastococcus sp. SYSU D00669]